MKYARKSKKTFKKPASTRMVPYNKFPMRAYAMGAPRIGLGPSCKTILRTSFFANCTAAASGIFTGFLSPGSCFDPSGDQSTIQPNTFDQFAAVYSRYKVDKAIVHMTVTGQNSSTGVGVGGSWHMAAYPSVSSTALTTFQGAASQPGAKTISGSYQLSSGNVGTGAEPKTVKFNLLHKAILGTAVDAYDSGALVTADPTAGQFMVLPFFIQANTAVAATFVIEVDIWQYVTFLQRKNVVDA